MKHCCRNCHFLARYFKEGAPWGSLAERPPEPWPRTPAIMNIAVSDRRPGCYMGVWGPARDMERDELDAVYDENRKGECFFFKLRPGMGFEAAETLQRRASEREDLKKTLLVATAAVLTSGVGILANLVLRLFDK